MVIFVLSNLEAPTKTFDFDQKSKNYSKKQEEMLEKHVISNNLQNFMQNIRKEIKTF